MPRSIFGKIVLARFNFGHRTNGNSWKWYIPEVHRRLTKAYKNGIFLSFLESLDCEMGTQINANTEYEDPPYSNRKSFGKNIQTPDQIDLLFYGVPFTNS